ncbi:MAG TPA: hypothetical protein VNT55_21915, partial [Baekduia sp.]|nr:hypothetical protein [Baekduia sp.]
MSTEDRTPREDDVDDVVTVDEAAKKRRLPRAPAWLLPVLPIAVLGAAGVLAGGGASYIALAGQASG